VHVLVGIKLGRITAHEVHVPGNTHLFEIVHAVGALRLQLGNDEHGQQQTCQYPDNRNDQQEFDQCK